jgi:hypothetical protein
VDYEFFESLSDDEARDYLARYLEVEARESNRMLDETRADGVKTDFSVESLTDLFRWLAPKIQMLETEPDPELPEWLRKSMEEHHGGFLDFDERSRPLALRASYYLGETFARRPGLAWSIGRPDRAEANQPVVTGFRTGADLPPLVIAENLLLTAGDSTYEERVHTAISTWDEAR